MQSSSSYVVVCCHKLPILRKSHHRLAMLETCLHHLQMHAGVWLHVSGYSTFIEVNHFLQASWHCWAEDNPLQRVVPFCAWNVHYSLLKYMTSSSVTHRLHIGHQELAGNWHTWLHRYGSQNLVIRCCKLSHLLPTAPQARVRTK